MRGTLAVALTARQQRFVAEYAVDLDATQAAIRAGYSEHTAMQQGSRLLSNVEIAAAVQRGNVVVLEQAAGSAAWVTEKAVEIVERSLDARPVYSGRGANREVVEGVWTYDGMT